VIAKRRKANAELVQRLRNPRPAKQRRPLAKPQPLLFEEGDALTCRLIERLHHPTSMRTNCTCGGFQQDGWGFGS
jgi:hypothetical protein